MMAFLDWTFLSNTVQAWLIAALVLMAAWTALKLVLRLARRQLQVLAERTETDLDDVAAAVLGATRPFFLFALALWAGTRVLSLPETAGTLVGHGVMLLVILQVAMWGSVAISVSIARYMERRLEDDASSATTVKFVGFVGRFALWLLLLLVALDNLGIEITTLVAGLGVGGIAVALAVQNILGDLFASLSIVLDKPFVIGDFIVVDDLLGIVEHVGLKTTRIRSLSGEQIVFANTDLLNARVRNFKRMYERRIVFAIGVTYETPYEKLARIPGIIRDIIEAQEQARFDRAHFHAYGDFSLNFEIVYYVLVPEYNTYMDVQQAINLELFRRFEAEEIEFAYPTQTLFVQQTSPVAAGG